MGRRTGVIVLLGVVCLLAVLWSKMGGPSWYGIAVMSLFLAKIVLSWRPRPFEPLRAAAWRAVGESDPAAVARIRVGAAVAVYNEDPAILAACLESLLAQVRPIDSIVVIDDCSADETSFHRASAMRERFEARGIEFTALRFGHNRGKRHVLMRALDLQPDADVLLGVDSDTMVDKYALARLVQAYARPNVTAVTGLVLALNYKRNLLTRLIDLRYAQSFLVDRSAQSRLGSMLCACGSLALYSAPVLRKYQRDFLEQRFMGRPAVFGDDRRLTNYCLMEGRAIMEETAVAYTAVPERLGHFLRQQIRWNKSFFRESWWVLRTMPLAKPALWFTFVELWSWVVFSFTLMYAVALAPLFTARLLLGPYLVYVMLMAYGRAFRYPDITAVRPLAADRWIGFIIAPLYGFLHIGILVWLRFYALLTLRGNAWGTRQRVEVTITPGPALAPAI